MHKAQATLESTLFFIIIAALSLGLISLWKGSSDTIVSRQKDFNASRVAAGSVPPGTSSSGNIPLEFTYNTIDAYLDYIDGSAYDLMSLEQINDNLENINQAIAGTQANIAQLTQIRDTWKSFFDEAQAQEVNAQQQIDNLQAQLDEKQRELDRGECDWWDDDGCGSLIAEINSLQEQIEMAINGYYTIETGWGDDWEITYDYSNAQWMSALGTREAWSNDYWMYQQYGVSPGNNKYGLYNDYTPGLLDWQSRKDVALSQLNDAQSNLDVMENTLDKLTAMQDKLLEAQEKKS
ncbi:MAG: hypothetical protein KJ710_01105 [Candidatus Omnitrophica bacterium]|nr:hypothetical protein [Candidatus Omnitrophota bacterium]MBU1922848.1 hypothetical protein [Candidatus Omnitrophota bacterium]